MNENDECWKSFNPNNYRCKTCGTFARCQSLKTKEERYKEIEEEDKHPCPNCGKDMQYDPGDGCVHEPEWYCGAPGCHFNDRAMATAMLVVAYQMRDKGSSEKEILKKLNDMKNKGVE